MNPRRAGVLVLAALVCASPLAAQVARSPIGSAAARSGWNAIRTGHNEEAAEAFAVAIAAEPRDPSNHLGAGVAAFLLGQRTAARHSLERALAMAPGLTRASLMLGDIQYLGSDIDGALRTYEAALPYAPANQVLIARIEKLRREAAVHETFFAAHGTHFTVLFEGPVDEALASRAIEILESAYWRVSTALSIYPEQVVTVVLYTRESFRDITRTPQWAAASYDGRIRVPVRGTAADSHELERVLAHEFTHALIQVAARAALPMWLHEGLAVMFEPGGDEFIDTQLSKSDKRLPLARLAKGFGGLSSPDARLAYAQSAGIVRAMFERGGPSAIGALLQDMARGATFAEAFEQQFFMTYDAFIASLEAPLDLLR